MPALLVQHAPWTPAAVMLLQSLYLSPPLHPRAIIPTPAPSVHLKIKIAMMVRRVISKRSREKIGDCEQSKRKESNFFSGKCDINSLSDKGIIRNYDKIIQIHFKHFDFFYLVFLGVGETIVGWLLCCCVGIAQCLFILLMCHVIWWLQLSATPRNYLIIYYRLLSCASLINNNQFY